MFQTRLHVRPKKHARRGEQGVVNQPAEGRWSIEPEDECEPAPERRCHDDVTILEPRERAGPAASPADGRGKCRHAGQERNESENTRPFLGPADPGPAEQHDRDGNQSQRHPGRPRPCQRSRHPESHRQELNGGPHPCDQASLEFRMKSSPEPAKVVDRQGQTGHDGKDECRGATSSARATRTDLDPGRPKQPERQSGDEHQPVPPQSASSTIPTPVITAIPGPGQEALATIGIRNAIASAVGNTLANMMLQRKLVAERG